MRQTEIAQAINEIENQAAIERNGGRNTNSKRGQSNPLLIYRIIWTGNLGLH